MGIILSAMNEFHYIRRENLREYHDGGSNNQLFREDATLS
jgi:hypothetical protein